MNTGGGAIGEGAGGRLRVLLYVSVPESDPEAVERAYHRVSARLAETPGLLGNELLRDLASPRDFAVMSDWASVRQFRAWEGRPEHRDATAPLRPYQSSASRAFGIYEVVAAYGSGRAGSEGG